FGFLGMVLSLLLFRFLREPQRGQSEIAHLELSLTSKPTVPEVLREFFRTPTAILLLLAFVGANFVAMTFLTWMPSFLVEKFNLRLTMAGVTGTVFIQLASAAGAPVSGFLSDRLG